jgi:hypothetical protein
MKQHIIFSLFIFLGASTQAQYLNQKKSTGPGTLFFYWGYNRSIYTPSTCLLYTSDAADDGPRV